MNSTQVLSSNYYREIRINFGWFSVVKFRNRFCLSYFSVSYINGKIYIIFIVGVAVDLGLPGGEFERQWEDLNPRTLG